MLLVLSFSLYLRPNVVMRLTAQSNVYDHLVLNRVIYNHLLLTASQSVVGYSWMQYTVQIIQSAAKQKKYQVIGVFCVVV